MYIVKEINTALVTSKCNSQQFYVNDIMFKNALYTQVLTLIALLLIKMTSSNFQEMFIKTISFLLSNLPESTG